MNKIARDIAVVTAGLVLTYGLLWMWSGGNEDPGQTPSSSESAHAVRGPRGIGSIAARPVDPATRPPLELSSSEDLPTMRALVDEHALTTADMDGDEWEATVIALADRAYVRDARVECGRTWGGQIERVCNYEIETVIDGSLDRAEVVYARARASDAETADSPGCRAFIGCIASTRLGSHVPVAPTHRGEMVAVRESLQSAHLPDEMYDPVYVKNAIEFNEEQIARIEAHLARKPGDTKAIRALRATESSNEHFQNFWLPELESDAP